MASHIERLARRVADLQTKVDRALTSPQLGNSSLENAKLEEYDSDGQLVSIIGKQPDGTHGAVVVSGPVPPRPSRPVLGSGAGLLTAAWDGNFADALSGETDITIPAPMDFSRVEVHASQESGFQALTTDTLISTVESPRGSMVSTVVEPGTWYVVLVARAASGKASRQSLEASVAVSGAPDVDGLREEFQTEMDGLAQDLNNNATQLEDAQGRLDTLTTRTGTVESSLATVQSQVNTKNKVINSTGNASGTTGYVAGDTWQKWSTLADGGKLVAAWRFTANNTWLPVILDPTYLPLVDIGAGTFGELSGGRLKAGSVEAQSLRLGVGPNLIPNGAGEWGTAGAWSEGLSWNTNNRPTGLPGSFISNGGTYVSPVVPWDVEPNTEYKFEVWVKANVAGSVIFIEMRDQDSAHAATWTAITGETSAAAGGYPVSNYAVPTGWTKLTAKGTTSATANKMRVGSVYFNHTNGTVRDATQYIAGMRMFRMTDGSMVVENTIKGKHVDAESVGAQVGAFVEADIGKLRVVGNSNLNTVTAERIAANVGSYLKLYASQLIIGEPGNMLPDPGFQDPEGWQLPANGYAILPTGGRNSNPALEIAASTSQVGRYYGAADKRRQFRVIGGATYQAKVWYKSDLGIGAANRIAIYGKWTNTSTNAAGNFATPGSMQNTGSVAANTWTELVYEFTVPAEATHAFIGLYVQAAHNSRVLFSEPSVREKITPSLIVDGFFQGLRVIGASIETNAAAETGFKLTDDGLTAHGAGIDYDPVAKTNINYKTRAKITTRATSWTSFAADRVPGLWFEANRVGSSGVTPPFDPAGLISSAAHAQGLTLLSSQQTANDYRSNVTVDQNFTQMGSRSDSATAGGVPKDHTTFTVYSSGFALNVSQGSTGRLSMNYSSSVPNELVVDINGKTVKLEDTGWNTASLLTNFQHRTTYGWAGVKWRAINGVFTLMGSVSRAAAWNTGEAIATIPTKYLPPHRVMGTNAYADLTSKTIQSENPGAAGAGLNFTVSWPYL